MFYLPFVFVYLVPALVVCSTRVLFVIASQHVFKNVGALFRFGGNAVHTLKLWLLQRALFGCVFVVSVLLRCMPHVFEFVLS